MNRQDALRINIKYIDRDFPDRKEFETYQPVSQPYSHFLEILLEDYVYTDEEFQMKVTVPAGWVWDGASIPSFAWAKVSDFSVGSPFLPQYRLASLVHDYLYRVQSCKRRTADKILKKLLLDSDVHRYEAGKMYFAVRLGGGIPWRRNKRTLH